MFHTEDTRDFDSTTYSRIQVQEYKKIYRNVIDVQRKCICKNLWTPHLVIFTSQLVQDFILILPRIVGSLNNRRISSNGWNKQVWWHGKAWVHGKGRRPSYRRGLDASSSKSAQLDPSGIDALSVPMKSCANLNQAVNSSWDAKTLPTRVSPFAVAYKSMRDLQNSWRFASGWRQMDVRVAESVCMWSTSSEISSINEEIAKRSISQ